MERLQNASHFVEKIPCFSISFAFGLCKTSSPFMHDFLCIQPPHTISFKKCSISTKPHRIEPSALST